LVFAVSAWHKFQILVGCARTMREHVSVLFGFGCVVSGEYGTGYRTVAEEALNPFDYCC
jgi:hypothetical protein